MARDVFEDNQTLSAAGLNAIFDAPTNYVRWGVKPTVGSGARDVDYTSGAVSLYGAYGETTGSPYNVFVTGGMVTLDSNAGNTDPRVDLITVDKTGTVDSITGTVGDPPAAPSIPDDEVLIAAVEVPDSGLGIAVSDLHDYRVIVPPSIKVTDEVGLDSIRTDAISASDNSLHVSAADTRREVLYTLGSGGQVYSLDISEPGSPVLIDSDTLGSGQYTSAYVSGDILHTITTAGEYRAIDARKPASLTSLGTVTPTSWSAGEDVVGTDEYVWAIDSTQEAAVTIDVRTPSNPTVIDTFNLSTEMTSPESIALRRYGDVVYVGAGSTGNDGLTALDVSVPSSISKIVTKTPGADCHDMVASRTADYLFHSSAGSGLKAFDISGTGSSYPALLDDSSGSTARGDIAVEEGGTPSVVYSLQTTGDVHARLWNPSVDEFGSNGGPVTSTVFDGGEPNYLHRTATHRGYCYLVGIDSAVDSIETFR